uniref:RING-type E3 ubiquitin transferase n=1 Tax=Rhabditophanes sp. KR3021 TaxID=114890 RepID=A0AC35U6I7_9BILA
MGQISSNLRNSFSFNRDHGSDVSNPNDSEAGEIIQNFQANADGAVFGSHFLMGGGIYESTKHDNFLFGELSDLEQIGNRPTHFPYDIQPGPDTIATLNTAVNVRRNSICFGKQKAKNESDVLIEFVLDCDTPCYIQIHFQAKEIIDGLSLGILHQDTKKVSSKKYYFDTGSNIQFNHFSFSPKKFNFLAETKDNNATDDAEIGSSLYSDIVIEIRSGTKDSKVVEKEQAQLTYCNVVKSNDRNSLLMLKPQRQKIFVDGVLYLLQEVYGIENKETDENMLDDNGSECVICMSDIRDTVILPCRHLCICNNCAETLRYKQNNCPICRAPFRALLQMKTCKIISNGTNSEGQTIQSNGRARYEIQTLVESLNGNTSTHMTSNESSFPKLSPATGMKDENEENSSKDHSSSNKSSGSTSKKGSKKDNIVKLQQVLKNDNKIKCDEVIELHSLENQSKLVLEKGTKSQKIDNDEEEKSTHLLKNAGEGNITLESVLKTTTTTSTPVKINTEESVGDDSVQREPRDIHKSLVTIESIEVMTETDSRN